MSKHAEPLSCGKDIADAERRSILLAVIAGLASVDAAQAQDAAAVQPRAYRVVLENDTLRVLEFISRPGMGVCGTGIHSHPAHLSIALSAMKARVKTADGKTFVGESKLGDVFWSEAETHETENISGKEARALMVELKSPQPKKA